LPKWVSPFGDLRVTGYLRLTEAYRCLSRPSSPADAKASSVCPCLLPTITFGLSGKSSFRFVPRFQHQEPIEPNPLSRIRSEQPVQCYKKCKKLKCLSTTPVLAFDACTHKEYGSPEKELQRRLGPWVPLIKESKKKVEPSMAGKLPSPIPIRLVIKRALPGIGGSGMSTSKNAS
jgi:hypothetical protein